MPQIEERLLEVEKRLEALEGLVRTLVSKEPVAKSRNWSNNQIEFLLTLHRHTNDLDFITRKFNEIWVPRGSVPRSNIAIACQLYKRIHKPLLSHKTIAIAERELGAK